MDNLLSIKIRGGFFPFIHEDVSSRREGGNDRYPQLYDRIIGLDRRHVNDIDNVRFR